MVTQLFQKRYLIEKVTERLYIFVSIFMSEICHTKIILLNKFCPTKDMIL